MRHRKTVGRWHDDGTFAWREFRESDLHHVSEREEGDKETMTLVAICVAALWGLFVGALVAAWVLI